MARGFGATYGVGPTDSIEIPYSTHGTQRTYAAWCYRNGAGGGNLGRIFDKRTSGAESELVHFYETESRFKFLRLWSSQMGKWSISDTIGTGAWFWIAVTYDSGSTANNAVFWLNGSKPTTLRETAPSGSLINNADNYVIGNRKSDNARAWDGMIAEFAIWDRILADAELEALADGYSPALIRNSLVSYVPQIRASGDWRNGASTVTGTTVIEHPRIIYPSRPKLVINYTEATTTTTTTTTTTSTTTTTTSTTTSTTSTSTTTTSSTSTTTTSTTSTTSTSTTTTTLPATETVSYIPSWRGISVQYSPSVVTGFGRSGTLTSQLSSYSHTIAVDGWFKSASVSFTANMKDIGLWVSSGLGHHIEVYNFSGELIWEGFVNKVNVDFSSLTVSLECVGYITYLEYVYTNTATSSYTLREKVIDVLVAEPNGVISTDYAYIETNTLSVFEEETGNKSGLQIIKDLIALGGDSNNNRRIFGLREGRKLFIEEIASDIEYLSPVPTSIATGPLTSITNQAAVTYKHPVYDIELETEQANDTDSQDKYGIFSKRISGGEVSAANATSIRDTWINENKNPETSQTVSGDVTVTDTNGNVIDPWNILPGKWLEFTALPASIEKSSELREDPRSMYIESVQFSAPTTISLTGSKVATIPQKLAKLGLSGV